MFKRSDFILSELFFTSGTNVVNFLSLKYGNSLHQNAFRNCHNHWDEKWNIRNFSFG
jgi:hypothetical protein